MEKNGKVRFRWYNVAITMLLGFLGYSCGDILNGDDEPKCLYGVPFAKYTVNGLVKSELNSTAISGIRVVLGRDTVYTNSEGKYKVTTQGMRSMDISFPVKFEDVDGVANGAFDALSTNAEYKNATFTGSDGWFEGEASKTLDVKLKPKQ